MDIEPAIPLATQPGRLNLFTNDAARRLIVSKNIPLLKPGWHCRWCRGELLQALDRDTGQPQAYVGCTTCDSRTRTCGHTLVEPGLVWHCALDIGHRGLHECHHKKWS